MSVEVHNVALFCALHFFRISMRVSSLSIILLMLLLIFSHTQNWLCQNWLCLPSCFSHLDLASDSFTHSFIHSFIHVMKVLLGGEVVVEICVYVAWRRL